MIHPTRTNLLQLRDRFVIRVVASPDAVGVDDNRAFPFLPVDFTEFAAGNFFRRDQVRQDIAGPHRRQLKKVADEHGLVSDDLYGFALPQLDKIQLPNNVHFTPDGSRVLAKQVAESIEKVIRAE